MKRYLLVKMSLILDGPLVWFWNSDVDSNSSMLMRFMKGGVWKLEMAYPYKKKQGRNFLHMENLYKCLTHFKPAITGIKYYLGFLIVDYRQKML